MKLWRLTRAPFVALDGQGALLNGARYAPPGVRVVSLTSEAGLAVLIALRYQLPDWAAAADDLVLGWTEVEAAPERVPDQDDEDAIRKFVGAWLTSRRSLLAALPSRVLPEGDVVLLNPAHPAAASVPPLTCRPFSFTECLHTPPMLAQFQARS